MVTYRTTDNDRWGAGKGSNLTPPEIDENFWQLDTRITVLEQNPTQPNQIESFQVTGTQMTVRMQDGTVHGPFTLPTAMIHYRGDWTPGFTYSELDLFTVQDDGLYLVLRPHQSADEFDPNAVNATGNALYRRLIPMSSGDGGGGTTLIVEEITLDEQSHIRLDETAIGKYLRISHLWNEATVYVEDDAVVDIPVNSQIWIENNADAPLWITSWNIALVNGENWEEPWEIGGLYSVAILTKVGPNEWTLKQFGGGGASVLNDLDNVNANPSVSGQILTWDGFVWVAADPPAGGGGASTFLELTDTPAAFGTAGQLAAINGTGDGLIFVDPPTGDGGITDAPIDGALYGRLDGAWSVVPALTWENIAEKPSTFPPSVHGHDWDEISNKPAIIVAFPSNVGAAGTVLKAQADGSIAWAIDETDDGGGVIGDGTAILAGQLVQELGPTNPSYSGSLYASKGILIDITQDMEIMGASADYAPATADVYKFVFARVNKADNTIVELLGETAELTNFSGANIVWFPLGATTISVKNGDRIAVIFVRTDGTATSPVEVLFGTSPGYDGIGFAFAGGIRYASNDPQINDAVYYDDVAPRLWLGSILRFNDFPSFGREQLTADRTYFVDPNGSNDNDGLSEATAFQTIQKAVDVLVSLDMMGFQVIIQVQNGTYTDPVELKPYLGFKQPIILGDETTPENVHLSCSDIGTGNGAFGGSAAGIWHVRGIKISVAVSGRGIYPKNGTIIRFQNLDFGEHVNSHIYAGSGSTVEVTGNYSISGGSSNEGHWLGNGWVICVGKTITLSNTPNFGLVFAFAGRGSVLEVFSNTFAGSGATGKKFDTHLNGVIFCNKPDPNAYFPGDVDGSQQTWNPVQ